VGWMQYVYPLTGIVYSVKHTRLPSFVWKWYLIDGCMTEVSHANINTGAVVFNPKLRYFKQADIHY
jgi:hypothetical protein